MVFGRKKRPYGRLEQAIGYRFKRSALLETALTHPSFRAENAEADDDNQRLEFLGDAVLGLLAAEYAYGQFEDEDEGGLTTFRSRLTSGAALAGLARSLDLGPHLRLGKGEMHGGGARRDSNMVDALEALFGAAYLDGGLRAAERLFRKVCVPSAEKLAVDRWADNPKGKLQEFCQRHWRKGPIYAVVRREGPAHGVLFTVEARLPDGSKASGRGRSRQGGEVAAARTALRNLADRGKR